MKKLHRVVLLLILFTFLSTYSHNEFGLIPERNNAFLKIQNIEIKNNFLVKTSEIKERLKKIHNKNILFVKGDDIQELLKDIDFLKKIEVRKKYPNTVIVKIFETKPVGILFKKKAKYVIDSSSNLTTLKNNMDFGQLPSIFGDGAEDNFIYFFNQLENNNFPKKEIKKYYFFQIGRWDLELLNNKTIKFPYNNTDKAIKKSIELMDRNDFENYNIIDLRIDGKIIVK